MCDYQEINQELSIRQNAEWLFSQMVAPGEKTITRNQLLQELPNLLPMEEYEYENIAALAEAAEFATMTEKQLTKLFFLHYGVGTKDLFEKLDSNKDGKIDKKELKAFLVKAGLKPSFFRFKEYASHMDTDGKPKEMNLEEFTAFMDEICLGTSDGAAAAASTDPTYAADVAYYADFMFDSIDTQSVGEISFEDLRKYMIQEGYTVDVREKVLDHLQTSDRINRAQLRDAYMMANKVGFKEGRTLTLEPDVLFDRIDRNGDGQVTMHELEHHFSRLGLKPKKIDKMDRNKQLDRAAFVELMKEWFADVSDHDY